MNKLSICICVYNKFNFTKNILADLSYLPFNHQIVIVDNNSSDETRNQLENSKEIIYYRFDVNHGFAVGSNKAYQLSDAENILFLNNDVRVKSNKENWTKEIIEKCSSGLVGPTFGLLNKDLSFNKEVNQYIDNKYSYLSGWCLGSSKEIFDKLIIKNYIGPFSEEFGIAYFEDTDLSFRAKIQNIKFQVVDIPVVHFGKQTSSQLNTYNLYSAARKIFFKKWNGKL